MDEKKTESQKRRFRGSLFGPLLLIFIGVVFLMQNIGAVDEGVWSTIWNLWPVLLIAWGLDDLLKRESFVWAAFLISLGVVFLLNNWGYLMVNILEIVSRLWPLLLIAIGLDIAIGRRSTWGAVIGMALIVAILIGALYFYGVRPISGRAMTGGQISQGIGGVSRARLVIEPAVGALRLDGVPEPDGLIQGSVHALGNEMVRQEYTISGDTGTFTLRGVGGAPFFNSDVPGQEWTWDLALTTTMPLEIKTAMGAGKTEIDLSGLNISGLEVSYGVGETIIFLPKSGSFEGEISGAIGAIHLVVPPGVGLRFDEDGAIVSIDVPEGFLQNGGLYTSPNFTQSETQIELKVNMAIGSISVEYANR